MIMIYLGFSLPVLLKTIMSDHKIEKENLKFNSYASQLVVDEI